MRSGSKVSLDTFQCTEIRPMTNPFDMDTFVSMFDIKAMCRLIYLFIKMHGIYMQTLLHGQRLLKVALSLN